MSKEFLRKNIEWFKYILIPIIILFVVLKTEFNHITNSEFYFKVLKFTYIISIATLFLLIMFFYKKIKTSQHYSILLFFITFLYYCYWIPYGLDITDTGYSLSNSWFISSETSFDIKGTFLLIGAWQHLIGVPSVFWCRIGYVLLLSCTSLFSFKIISIFYTDNKFFTFLSVLVVSLLPIVWSSFTLDYDMVPVAILLLSMYFFSKALIFNKKRNFILSGIFITISIFTRIPYILFLIVPVLLLYQTYRFNKDFQLFKRNMIYSFMGIIIGLLLVIGILIKIDFLDNYIDLLPTSRIFSIFFNNKIQVESHTNSTHSISYLLELYQKDLWNIFKIGFIFHFIILIPVFLNVKGIFKIIIIMILAWLFYYYSSHVLAKEWYYAILAINISGLLFILYNHRRMKQETVILLIISMFVAMISFLGSNTGLQKIIHSGGIVLILSVVLVFLRQTKLQFNSIEYNFKIVYYILLIGVTFFAFNKRYSHLYRDTDRDKLTTMYETPALWGIYSSPERVSVVDRLVNVIDSLEIEDNEYLVVNYCHIFPYVMDIEPISMIWDTPFEQYKNRFDNNDISKYIILSLRNPRRQDWPNTRSRYSGRDKDNIEKFKKDIKDFYKRVYRNKMFAVYVYDIEKTKKSLRIGKKAIKR